MPANPDTLLSGQIPIASGLAGVVRIPIPGTNGLAIELKTRDPRWVDRSTSTLFFQDAAGRRNLRLDYGYNKTTRTFDYHWNHERAFKDFKIENHAPAGSGGKALYQFSKYFRYGSRVLVVAGATLDIVSVVQASKPLRRASEVVTAWAGAWVGCKAVGSLGAAGGTAVTPGVGTAIGGFAGCIVGGIGGYGAGSALGGAVYDWAEDTIFTPLPQADTP